MFRRYQDSFSLRCCPLHLRKMRAQCILPMANTDICSFWWCVFLKRNHPRVVTMYWWGKTQVQVLQLLKVILWDKSYYFLSKFPLGHKVTIKSFSFNSFYGFLSLASLVVCSLLLKEIHQLVKHDKSIWHVLASETGLVYLYIYEQLRPCYVKYSYSERRLWKVNFFGCFCNV